MSDAIARLIQWRDVGDGPIKYCAGDQEFADDVKAALANIDRITAERDALRVVLTGLNETLDSYWNGDKSDLMVKLITGWQRRCKAVLTSSLSDANRKRP